MILELPLVIGTAGLGSRSNSVSSQEGSVSNASQSWVSLQMPSNPPSYSDMTRDVRLDQPLTPLLCDCDDIDGSPIFMRSPSFQFPSPPVFAEVRRSTGFCAFLAAAGTVLKVLVLLRVLQTEEEYNGNNVCMLPVC